jgi:hypothetical protein
MNDKFFLGEKLERAVSFRVNGISKVAVNGWEDGDDRAALMVVSYIVDQLANRKFCHRDPLRNHWCDYIATNELTLLNYGLRSASPQIGRRLLF